jgi:hypothetical protein
MVQADINSVIRDVAQALRISRYNAAQLCEDAQIALENACDDDEEFESITAAQVKKMAIDMGRKDARVARRHAARLCK